VDHIYWTYTQRTYWWADAALREMV